MQTKQGYPKIVPKNVWIFLLIVAIVARYMINPLFCP